MSTVTAKRVRDRDKSYEKDMKRIAKSSNRWAGLAQVG